MKVYSYPIMTQIIDQISKQDICGLDDLARAAEDLYQGIESRAIYFIRVDENNENVMFFCEAHLNIIVLSEMRYDSTSETENNVYFDSVKKRFCVGCVRHFCQKFTYLFAHVDFSLVSFCVM